VDSRSRAEVAAPPSRQAAGACALTRRAVGIQVAPPSHPESPCRRAVGLQGLRLDPSRRQAPGRASELLHYRVLRPDPPGRRNAAGEGGRERREWEKEKI
jgi:hypothetical protein